MSTEMHNDKERKKREKEINTQHVHVHLLPPPDHVFGESSATDQVYSTITKPIVHSVMEGVNGMDSTAYMYMYMHTR